MPKRTDDYMKKQRDQIARAALVTMLKKGLHDTSLRDISEAAGVSLGALYIHFANKEELVLEVCRHPQFPMSPETAVRSWSDYEVPVRYLKIIHGSQPWRQRIRLSLEFAAELALAKDVAHIAGPLLQTRVDWHRKSLETLQKSGEISLPMGLDRTARACNRLITGTWYMIAADSDLDIDCEIEMLLETLRTLAGRVTGAQSAKKPERIRSAHTIKALRRVQR